MDRKQRRKEYDKKYREKSRVKVVCSICHKEYTINKSHLNHYNGRCQQCWNAAQKTMRTSEEKKMARKNNYTKYAKSDKRKVCLRRYYIKNRERKDWKLNRLIALHIRLEIKKKKNYIHWEKIVGYSLSDLITHLEKQFDENMN